MAARRSEKGAKPPDLEHAVPRSGAERHAVRADAEAADAVLVPSEDPDPLALERVPDVAVKVVVAGKEEATRDGEADRSDAAQDVVVRVLVQLAVGAKVEQAAGSVVGTGREGVAVREEAARIGDGETSPTFSLRTAIPVRQNLRDGVDIGLVARKSLHGLARPDVPHLGGRVTRARHEDVLIRPDRKTMKHGVSEVRTPEARAWPDHRARTSSHRRCDH